MKKIRQTDYYNIILRVWFSLALSKWLISISSHVSSNFILVECLVTSGAVKWLFSCVGPLMSLQILSCWMLCRMWSSKMAFLPCEFSHVSSNFILVECLVTSGAVKWFFCHVGSHVSSNLVLVECLVTSGAVKWLFSHVGPLMSLQILSCWMPYHKWSSKIAFLPHGSSHVSSNFLLVECLVTFGAVEWLFSSVGPLMSLRILFLLNALSQVEQ